MNNVAPLMPKATAVWLVENTSLTFEQIADFCKLHPLEVKGIADGEVATGIKGHDPITSGQLAREEIAAGEKDKAHHLKLAVSKVVLPPVKKRSSIGSIDPLKTSGVLGSRSLSTRYCPPESPNGLMMPARKPARNNVL